MTSSDVSGKQIPETYEWNKYIIHRPAIGKGMYSKVYYAIHKDTKQEVALKKILFSKLHNNVKDKVITEIHILQKMDHPHIMKLYEYKFDGDYLLLITEYCKDHDLDQWLQKPHTHEELLDSMRQIALGMEYLHTNNILHRDIKPQNILLHQGVIKICDFGFSTMIKEQHQMFNTVCGTPLYMSPELLLLKPYTIKSDIWSIGILFYTMLYKSHPFGKLHTLDEYRFKIKNVIAFLPIADYEYLVELIQLMLMYTPEERPDMSMIVRSLKLKYVDKTNVFDTIALEEKIQEPAKDHVQRIMEPMEDRDQRIMELEEQVFKLESMIKEKEMSRSYICCFDSEDRESDVTGRGRTNKGYEHEYINIDTDYFTPPDTISKAIAIPRKKNLSDSSSSDKSKGSSLSSSFGTFFNFLTKSFSK
jgi:serine/threonine protein kinase